MRGTLAHQRRAQSRATPQIEHPLETLRRLGRQAIDQHAVALIAQGIDQVRVEVGRILVKQVLHIHLRWPRHRPHASDRGQEITGQCRIGALSQRLAVANGGLIVRPCLPIQLPQFDPGRGLGHVALQQFAVGVDGIDPTAQPAQATGPAQRQIGMPPSPGNGLLQRGQGFGPLPQFRASHPQRRPAVGGLGFGAQCLAQGFEGLRVALQMHPGHPQIQQHRRTPGRPLQGFTEGGLGCLKVALLEEGYPGGKRLSRAFDGLGLHKAPV